MRRRDKLELIVTVILAVVTGIMVCACMAYWSWLAVPIGWTW